MDAISGSTWLWIGFSLFILTMLSLDLGLFNRKAHTIRYQGSVDLERRLGNAGYDLCRTRLSLSGLTTRP